MFCGGCAKHFFIYYDEITVMAISKEKKQLLSSSYAQQLASASWVVVFNQKWLSVNDLNDLRKAIRREWWKLEVTKKRLFARTIDASDYDSVQLDQLEWSIAVLYSNNPDNVYWPLKAVSNFIKQAKKEKKPSTIEFVWWWFDKKRADPAYVTELANIPSREELISKLLFLVKYPVQWFAQVLDQIAQKQA